MDHELASTGSARDLHRKTCTRIDGIAVPIVSGELLAVEQDGRVVAASIGPRRQYDRGQRRSTSLTIDAVRAKGGGTSRVRRQELLRAWINCLNLRFCAFT
jgi:hypothetical protein